MMILNPHAITGLQRWTVPRTNTSRAKPDEILIGVEQALRQLMCFGSDYLVIFGPVMTGRGESSEVTSFLQVKADDSIAGDDSQRQRQLMAD
ncbi:hypothetical protein AVEN_103084-1 [Araneus ventricosus]|uniref:Uncharacterized protein n=1 Tax=Araneus ventricosus TaxID=182803 RepID=A0A4Y2B9K1_ARAVE|nr:hypothetical protein AVEN_103084-1 [Araneus ventricosus]